MDPNPIYINAHMNKTKPTMSDAFQDVTVELLPRDTSCDFCVMSLQARRASKMCNQCRRPICESCSQTHRLSQRYSDHTFMDESADGLVSLMCKNHPSQEITTFCQPCKRACCTQCRDQATHAKHEFISFDQALEALRNELTEKRFAMKGKLGRTNDLLLNTSAVEQKVKADFEQVKREIGQRADNMVQQILEWKEDTELRLEETNKAEAVIWKKRVDDLYLTVGKTKNYADFLETVITNESAGGFITRCKEVDDKLYESLLGSDEEPLVAPSVQLGPVKGSGKGGATGGILTGEQLREIVGDLKVKTYNQTYGNVAKISGEVAWKPETARVREIAGMKQMAGVQEILGMKQTAQKKLPTPPKEECQPEQQGKKLLWTADIGESAGHVRFPISVGLTSDKHTIVSEAGNKRVQCFDINGKSVWSHGNGQNKIDPRGIAISPHEDSIYVTDVLKGEVRIIDKSGKKVGTWGNLDVGYPKDIAISQNGNVIVVDKKRAKILICASDGRQIKAFGSKGNDDEQFLEPNYVKTDSRGRIYVSDTMRKQIKIFNNFGVFQKKFAPKVNGKLQSFHGISIDDQDNILVALHDMHSIGKFSADGAYIESVLDRADGLRRPATLFGGSPTHMVVAETHTEERHSAVRLYRL